MLFNTFKGGITPSPNKNLTKGKEFFNLSVPSICYIPLLQHIGAPARPVVKIGDSVKEGQLIGKADSPDSVNIHSSIPGKVIDICDFPGIFSKNTQCVVVEADGKFSTSGKSHNIIPWQDANREILLERIHEAGIIDMSGNPVALSAKLSPQSGVKIKNIVINAVEEPYITSNFMLIKTYPADIIEGINIILKITGIDKIYIAVDNDKIPSLKMLKELIAGYPFADKIQVLAVNPKYPQNAEKILISSVLKVKIKPGTTPADSGIAVLDISTIYAVREAVIYNKPLFERFVTVSGSIINNPGNYKIRAGTRISDVIDECGGIKENPYKIIMGGPMRGAAITDINMPVLKGTSCILFLSEKEAGTGDYSPCIRCGRCVSACPMRLLPYKYTVDQMTNLRPDECIMCGACSYVCPAHRQLSIAK